MIEYTAMALPDGAFHSELVALSTLLDREQGLDESEPFARPIGCLSRLRLPVGLVLEEVAPSAEQVEEWVIHPGCASHDDAISGYGAMLRHYPNVLAALGKTALIGGDSLRVRLSADARADPATTPASGSLSLIPYVLSFMIRGERRSLSRGEADGAGRLTTLQDSRK